MAPPLLVPSRPAAGGAGAAILAGVRAGDGPGVDELVTLFEARRQDVAAVAALADELRRETVGDTSRGSTTATSTTPTCARFKCRFCGFSKGPLSLNLRGAPYLLTLDDIAERRREAWERSAARSRCRPVSTISAAR